MPLQQKAFENIVEKGEIFKNEQFLSFSNNRMCYMDRVENIITKGEVAHFDQCDFDHTYFISYII